MTAVRGRPRVRVAPCRFCHKTFKRQEHLKRHERIHTREKPFLCGCGEGFARQDMLARHGRLAHPDDNGLDEIAPETELVTQSAEVEAQVFESTALEQENSEDYTLQHDASGGEARRNFFEPMGSDLSGHHVMHSSYVNKTIHQYQDSSTHGAVQPTSTELEDPTNMHADEPMPNLLSMSNASSDLDFLWNEAHPNHNAFLPVDFFDTEYSIVDISQRFTDSQHETSAHLHIPILPAAGEVAQQDAPSSKITEQLELDEETPQPHMISRLPSLEPAESAAAPCSVHNGHSELFVEEALNSTRWTVTHEVHQRLSKECERHQSSSVSPSFQLPSRHALTRYMEGYLRRFHDHMPFLHIPTFTPAAASPEALLAFTAVGALHKFEHTTGYDLYEMAQAIISWRFRQARRNNVDRLTSTLPKYASMSASLDGSSAENSSSAFSSPSGQSAVFDMDETMKISMLQAMVVLLAISSWGDRSLVPDSLSMTSRVAMLSRELGISQPNITDSKMVSLGWEDWAKAEERRRTLSVAYALTNLQSVAFDVPPAILNHQIALDLPVSGPEWKASSAAEWMRVRSLVPTPARSFRHSLSSLMEGVAATPDSPYTAFGIYLLIHGLLQQIFFARQTSGCQSPSESSLPRSFVKQMEKALRAWQNSWEAMYESTLDPASPKGPVSFNATALLRLAHIRLNVSIGPDAQFLNRDPKVIAAAVVDANIHTTESSCRHLDRAVLQSIHALSIPVRIGVTWMARTQTSNWSVQHALCNLECALLLIHWLQVMAGRLEASGPEVLHPDQIKLLNMVISLVRETDLRKTLFIDQSQPVRIRRLAASIAAIWAETFKGFHVFEMVHVIGTGISMVVDKLNSQLTRSSS